MENAEPNTKTTRQDNILTYYIEDWDTRFGRIDIRTKPY